MFDNRITDAVASMATRIAALDPEKVASLEENASLDMGDWLALGDKSSRAMIGGLVTADEAIALHGIHTRYNGTATLAERLVFLQVMGEVLARV